MGSTPPPLWIPVVMMLLGFVSLAISLVAQLRLPEIVRYAIRSEIRDQVSAHDSDALAHQSHAGVRRLRRHTREVDDSLHHLIAHAGHPISHERFDDDD